MSETPQPISAREPSAMIVREFEQRGEDQARTKDGNRASSSGIVPQAAPDPASMISIEVLRRRPSRPPDYAAENCALVALAQEMAGSPDGILQKLAGTALILCRAHSAGLSLLESGDQKRNFHWRAIAGRWAPHVGEGTPRDFSPCGTVLDRNEALLCVHPERDFPYFAEVTPLLEEGLLIPFYIAGEPVGTIWVIAHDSSRRFDAEDLRVMTSLGTFAAASYQTLLSVKAVVEANRELARSASSLQRAASIVESSDDAIISKDLDGVITSWNNGAERVFGYAADDAIGKPISILIPADRPDEEPTILARVRRGQRIDHYETVRRRKDGTLIDISLTVSPLKDADGKVIGASKIARNITERRRAQDQQNLLLREMSHRVKNLFAVTNSLVALSARSARTPQEMAEAIQDRLHALTRAHELTRPGLIDTEGKASEVTTLHALIRTIFDPYASRRSRGSDGIILTGPDLPIGEHAITNVALVLHELATNAAKYGALSAPGGVVHIDCSFEKGEFVLEWKEHGGPALAGPPDGEGFGGMLARRIVTYQFGGRLSNDWQPDGLAVRMLVPLERLKS